MAINKLALIRYKTIDNCLQNRFRKWTLEDLMEACSEALYEFEGITNGVSKRTIQLDIQTMRSEKLGYNAPIVVTDKKYYSYKEKGYSINNAPVTQQDLGTLNDVLAILKQFKGFGYFKELTEMVTKLEDKLYKQKHKGKSYIEFEKNDLLKGLEYIDPLNKAIIGKKVLEITYRSFKVREAQQIIFYPYLLKEYRNRWFILGANKRGMATTLLALDRIEFIKEVPALEFQKPGFEIRTFFNDVIGVSKMPNQKPIKVVMAIHRKEAPYILTKPMHPSQTVIKEVNNSMLFSIEVVWNFELEREILGFGEQIRVLSPKRLAGKIQSRLKKAAESYLDPLEII